MYVVVVVNISSAWTMDEKTIITINSTYRFFMTQLPKKITPLSQTFSI